jgi:hypothetical protein
VSEPDLLIASERVALGPLRVDLAVATPESQRAWVEDNNKAAGERRNQGLGSEATRLTLDWAFHVLGLPRRSPPSRASRPPTRARRAAGWRRTAA